MYLAFTRKLYIIGIVLKNYMCMSYFYSDFENNCRSNLLTSKFLFTKYVYYETLNNTGIEKHEKQSKNRL